MSGGGGRSAPNDKIKQRCATMDFSNRKKETIWTKMKQCEVKGKVKPTLRQFLDISSVSIKSSWVRSPCWLILDRDWFHKKQRESEWETKMRCTYGHVCSTFFCSSHWGGVRCLCVCMYVDASKFKFQVNFNLQEAWHQFDIFVRKSTIFVYVSRHT